MDSIGLPHPGFWRMSWPGLIERGVAPAEVCGAGKISPLIKSRLARDFCLHARPGSLHLRQRGMRTALTIPELVMTSLKG